MALRVYHSSVDGRLGSFQVLAIGNSAAVSITPEFLCETKVARPGQVAGEVKGLMDRPF